MADVRPFKAIRPAKDMVHLVASRSYVSYSTDALRSKLDENPFTFLHILNPEYNQEIQSKSNSVERFEKVKEKFGEFVRAKILIHDQNDSFYIYRQIKEGHHYIGIIACASVEDYYADIIKKHEATITQREKVFKDYLKTVEINAEPVCFTYPNHAEIDAITEDKIKDVPEYDFTTTNRVRHTFWCINNPDTIHSLKNYFGEISSIYIADGHHRSASSALLGKELKEANPNHNGSEGYNYFMGYFVPESNLKVFEFNRLVTTLGGYSTNDFLTEIQRDFNLSDAKEENFKPQKCHEIGMYLDGNWYCLEPKETILLPNDPVNCLDVSILTNHILAPILGISDLKTDDRIYFKGGLEGINALKEDVDIGKAKIAFAHYPVSVEELKTISDRGEIMPPKSTWVEPKLRSGLSIYSTK